MDIWSHILLIAKYSAHKINYGGTFLVNILRLYQPIIIDLITLLLTYFFDLLLYLQMYQYNLYILNIRQLFGFLFVNYMLNKCKYQKVGQKAVSA